jgi:AraC-like DNA-binding protein
MRARGKTLGQISIRLGFSKTTIRRWLDPEFNRRCREAVLRYRAAHRERLTAYYAEKSRERRDGVCDGCGEPVAKADTRQCRKCRDQDREFLRNEIAHLWNDEHLMAKEIGERLGRTHDAIMQQVIRMRREGWNLERRR